MKIKKYITESNLTKEIETLEETADTETTADDIPDEDIIVDDVLSAFKGVQEVTHCSTGCGGCHQKVLDIISSIMSGAEI